MADQRKVELILGIKTVGAVDATQGLDSIGKVAAQLSGELSKLERADVLTQLGRTAAQVATDTNDVTAAATRLADELKAVGATEVEIRRVSKAFDSTVASIEKADKAAADAAAKNERYQQQQVDKFLRAQKSQIEQVEKFKKAQTDAANAAEHQIREADKAQEEYIVNQRLAAAGATTLQKSLGQIARAQQIDRIGTEMGLLAKKTKDAAGAANQLNTQLKEIGASKEEVQAAAVAFTNAGSGGSGNRLGRIGSELRALPSTQIPGLGVSSDQVAGIIRLGGAISGVSEKAAEASRIGLALTPILGQTAAGFVALTASAAPFIAAIGLIALAVKNFADEQAKQAAAINATVDAQREVTQQIAEGLTSEEAKKQLEENNRKIQEEIELRNKLQQVYNENIENQGALTGVLKVASGAEDALSGQIGTSTTKIQELETANQALTVALDDGTLAANDAAEAEKKLADERSKSALNSADAAARELQAEQRALNATEDQNKKRLESIEDEKAVLELQIKTLQESGVTSEEVTSKLAALNGQLGSLGKESDFITKTALEASRQADAAKKAQKESEDAAKKAEQAQTQYTKAVASAGTQYTQSLQDIGIRARQVIADNQTKFDRDLTDIATKYRRDEFDLTIKADRAERDAAQEQVQDLQKIQSDARKDEQEALREGDFKALFLAREQQAETLKQEQTTLDETAKKREQAQADARADLLTNAQRQRTDRIIAFGRQTTDARTAQDRDYAQAQLARNRQLQAAREGLNAELAQYQAFWKQFGAVGANGMKQALAMASGQGGTGANTSSPATFKAVTKIVGMAIRR